MIIVKIRKWKVINDLEHTSTTWEIATDENFENIVELHEESDMLELLFSTLEVPKDTSYWVRAKRHFNASGVDYWLNPVKVTNMEESYGNMLMQKDSRIQQPYVYITDKEILSSDKTITIKSSRFYSNVDQHQSTSWFIFDGRDNLLWSSINDTVNLESIVAPNLPIYKNKSKLKFVVIYRGITGVESKAGILAINNNGKVNYEIESVLNNINPLEDLVIRFRPIIESQPLGISNLYLTDYSNPDSIIKELVIETDNTVTLPWYYFKEGSKYNLKIIANVGGVAITQNKVITVEDALDFNVKDPSYVYKNELIESESYDVTIPEGIYVEALPGNIILIPSVKHDKLIVHGYNEENNILTNTKVFADGISLISNNIDGYMVKPISRTRVLIDQLGSDGKPHFMIYDYDPATTKFTLKHNVKRDTETSCMGKTGAIVQVSNSEVIYNPIGSNELRKLNLLTGEITNYDDIPLEEITKGILIRCKDNRIYVGNGADYQAVIFNSVNGDYTTGYSFGPSNFINKTVLTVPMLNGNTLIVCNELGGRNPVTNFSVLDFSSSSFKHGKILLDKPFESVISLSNGYILFTNRISNEDTSVIKTGFRIYR